MTNPQTAPLPAPELASIVIKAAPLDRGSVLWTVVASLAFLFFIFQWPVASYFLLLWSLVVAILPILPSGKHGVDSLLRFYLSDSTDLARDAHGKVRLPKWIISQIFVSAIRATFLFSFPLILLYARRKIDPPSLKLEVFESYTARLKFLSILGAIAGLFVFAFRFSVVFLGEYLITYFSDKSFVYRFLLWLLLPPTIDLWHVAAPVGGLLFLYSINLVDRDYAAYHADGDYIPSRRRLLWRTVVSRLCIPIAWYCYLCALWNILPIFGEISFRPFQLRVFPW